MITYQIDIWEFRHNVFDDWTTNGKLKLCLSLYALGHYCHKVNFFPLNWTKDFLPFFKGLIPGFWKRWVKSGLIYAEKRFYISIMFAAHLPCVKLQWLAMALVRSCYKYNQGDAWRLKEFSNIEITIEDMWIKFRI